MGGEVEGGKNGSAYEDYALDDVAPDDGFDSAHGAVDDGDDAHEEYAEVDVDAGDGGKGEGGEVHDEGHAGYHEGTEKGGGHEAGGEVEAVF